MERKFIKAYNQFVNESKENNDLIIPKSTELFHSTVEDFDIKDLTTGGYDNILWTSKQSSISQTYIPVSGSRMFSKTSNFHRPSFHENSRNVQRQLGILYDYDKVEFDNRGNATSWVTPDIWKKESDKAQLWANKHYELSKKIRDIKKELEKSEEEFRDKRETMSSEERKEFRNYQSKFILEIINLEKKYETQSKEYNKKGTSKGYEYETINKALRELGYEPTESYGSDNDYTWDLKMSHNADGDIILPADYRANGRLLIIKPKEDLRIFDYAGDNDGDLMDLDYHKLELFKKVEADGYDGIRINDFAQIENVGNFGHESIGLFKSTIPKLDIKSIPAVHPTNFYNNHMNTGDYESKEYKEYKSNK